MAEEIISYLEMCQREGINLQRGMNFRVNGDHSVILMSVRPGAPYQDAVSDDGTELIYEGHDEPNRQGGPDPKTMDQPRLTAKGSLTENGKFHDAAQAYVRQGRLPERVRVYEKLRAGIWSFNGVFLLVDSWLESDGARQVFKFKLVLSNDQGIEPNTTFIPQERQRLIPTAVKLAVWQRDGGRCVECGATDELHFDHVIPYSKGGTSLTVANVQLLCARCNLTKGAKLA